MTNRNAHEKELKLYRGKAGKINCGICPYHKGENSDHNDNNNWKNHRKKQYRDKAA